ncbi:hypothetical protein C8J56DRAFT_1060199 [Mycena floridula]|nr:hypothetical protein C8J56DRAFT_1060199 [Mycena floridula]
MSQHEQNSALVSRCILDFLLNRPSHDQDQIEPLCVEVKGRIEVQIPAAQVIAQQANEIRGLREQSAKHKDVIDRLVHEIDQLTMKLDDHQEPIRIQQLEQQHSVDLACISKLKRTNAQLRSSVDDTRDEIAVLQQNLNTRRFFRSLERLEEAQKCSRAYRRYQRRRRELMGTDYHSSSDEESSEPSSNSQTSEEAF